MFVILARLIRLSISFVCISKKAQSHKRSKSPKNDLLISCGTFKLHTMNLFPTFSEKYLIRVSKEGMMMNGTNGSQLWDTTFIVQAMVESGIKHIYVVEHNDLLICITTNIHDATQRTRGRITKS